MANGEAAVGPWGRRRGRGNVSTPDEPTGGFCIGRGGRSGFPMSTDVARYALLRTPN